MAQVIISHPDGRRYEVSDKAFADLYEPFGFTVEGISYQGSLIPDTADNRTKANAAYGTDPNETALTRENAARAVILSDLEAEARQRLAAESSVGAEVVNPNATDSSAKGKAAKADASEGKA